MSIPVTLEAQGFDIPKHPTLKNNHWLDYSYINKYYAKRPGFKFPQDFSGFMALYRRHLEVLERYRVATYPFGPMNWEWIAASRELDGHYRFDFAKLKEVVELAREHGANWFCSSFGCNPGGVIPIETRHHARPRPRQRQDRGAQGMP